MWHLTLSKQARCIWAWMSYFSSGSCFFVTKTSIPKRSRLPLSTSFALLRLFFFFHEKMHALKKDWMFTELFSSFHSSLFPHFQRCTLTIAVCFRGKRKIEIFRKIIHLGLYFVNVAH